MALAGYRNLAALKFRLLPADMGDASDYDSDLSGIGLGVAAMFDKITGRELRRNAEAAFECPADVESVVLRSYPIEEITSVTISGPGYSQVITSAVTGLQHGSGIVDFGCQIGSHLDRLVIVSAGGYWCQDGDDDEQPAGSAALPDDLLQAWFQQCRAVCDAENIFRQKGAGNFTDKDKREPSLRLGTLDLLPAVKRTLQLYMRIP